MIAFPGMLVPAAEKAGMPVPPDPDDFSREKYPHFQVFCTAQLGRAVTHGEQWENAEIIAKFTDEEIVKATLEDLIAKGFHIIT